MFIVFGQQSCTPTTPPKKPVVPRSKKKVACCPNINHYMNHLKLEVYKNHFCFQKNSFKTWDIWTSFFSSKLFFLFIGFSRLKRSWDWRFPSPQIGTRRKSFLGTCGKQFGWYGDSCLGLRLWLGHQWHLEVGEPQFLFFTTLDRQKPGGMFNGRKSL